MIAPIFSWLSWLFERIELNVLQKVFYILSNLVLILGIIELVRHRKIRKSDKFKSKAEKTTELALSPEKQAEELLRTVSAYERMIRFMLTKIKNMFKWLWGNKQAILSIISSLLFVGLSQYALYTDLFLQWDFFVENTLLCQIACGVLTGLFLINLFYTIGNKYGFENLVQIAERLAGVKERKANKLTKEQKAQVKAQYNTIDAEYKKAIADVKKFTDTIKDYEVLSSIDGITISSEKTNAYQVALANIENAKLTVDALKNQKDKLNAVLKK